MNRKFLSQRGAGILDAVMGAGLLGVLAFFSATMIKNTQKGQKGVQNAVDFDVMKYSILMVLNRPQLCKNAFVKSDGTTVARFDDPPPPPVHQAHMIKIGSSIVVEKDQIINGGLKITRLEIQKIPGTVVDTTSSPGHKIYDVQLIIEAKKGAGSSGVAHLSNVSNPFRFSLKTNASNTIVACDGSGDATPFNPVNATWTGFFAGDQMKETTAGQYICGIRFREDCDFYSSDNACINLKICKP